MSAFDFAHAHPGMSLTVVLVLCLVVCPMVCLTIAHVAEQIGRRR